MRELGRSRPGWRCCAVSRPPTVACDAPPGFVFNQAIRSFRSFAGIALFAAKTLVLSRAERSAGSPSPRHRLLHSPRGYPATTERVAVRERPIVPAARRIRALCGCQATPTNLCAVTGGLATPTLEPRSKAFPAFTACRDVLRRLRLSMSDALQSARSSSGHNTQT